MTSPHQAVAFIAAEAAKKRALVGMAALVLNPLRDAVEGGERIDRSDDTALLIQTLARVKEHFRGLDAAGLSLSPGGADTYAMVCNSIDMLRARMEEQG